MLSQSGKILGIIEVHLTFYIVSTAILLLDKIRYLDHTDFNLRAGVGHSFHLKDIAFLEVLDTKMANFFIHLDFDDVTHLWLMLSLIAVNIP